MLNAGGNCTTQKNPIKISLTVFFVFVFFPVASLQESENTINLKDPSLRSMRENHECFHKLLLLPNFHCCVVAATITPQPTDFSSFKWPNSTLKVSLRTEDLYCVAASGTSSESLLKWKKKVRLWMRHIGDVT